MPTGSPSPPASSRRPGSATASAGGAVSQGINWHWIFWINVPIGVAAVVLSMRLLPESHGAREPLGLAGVGLVTGGVVAIVWALVRANQSGWTSPEIIATLGAGAVLLVAFVGWEKLLATLSATAITSRTAEPAPEPEPSAYALSIAAARDTSG